MPLKAIRSAILEALGQESVAPDDSEQDLNLAVACLMIELCQSDETTTDDELDQVAVMLRQTFDLDQDLVQSLIAQARTRHRKDTSFYPYVSLVNEQLQIEEKETLLRQMWRVAQADGRIDKYEEHYLRRLTDLMRLPPRSFIQSRLDVLGE